MQAKVFEVRDRNTFLPVLAVKMEPTNDANRYLMRRVGFTDGTAVMLTRLNGETPASADAYFWGDRTMSTVHLHIDREWDSLRDGDVIDVEFLLGETKEPKMSERLAPITF